MNRLYITLSQTYESVNPFRFYITNSLHEIPVQQATSRTSPIYLAYPEKIKELNPLPTKGFVFFLFTLDTFYLLGLLGDHLSEQPILSRIFITHGLASVVIISDTEEEVTSIVDLAKSHTITYEKWQFDGNRIIQNQVSPVKSIPPKEIELDWPLATLSHEDTVFVNNASVILKRCMNTASQFIPQYCPLLDAIAIDMICILYTLLFIEGQCDEVEQIGRAHV